MPPSTKVPVEWAKVVAKYKLKPSTAVQIKAFLTRHAEAASRLGKLREQDTSLDFKHYRQLLSNKEIVDKIESHVKRFKPVKIDLSSQMKIIEAFEAKANKNAAETAALVKKELSSLYKTLQDIEKARPVTDLTIDDVKDATAEVEQIVSDMVRTGNYHIPGYKEKFGDLSIM
ncbi:F0-ATPase subunit D [Schizosaccharomyces japonicus yFS275]|uniref:ATP synthase subunit d, mitochondrial n=1 Tax=Schizosaccharomyces japonicus (strain yFS275 / FY16936) TaxID=402676 RepID=B6K5F0_SCHJY|nr:F0-ATPase subunit D [Schizosaccharomyces japonicus yFS275]EEB08754.1 F0-ATPase subunit D [Schizosaccharomyces japonicus yFS275]